MTQPIDILKQYWKHQSFREPQSKIIEAVLKQKDVIALLPTGGGKSVCFQIPGILLEGVTIVISPLIALMKDQVNALNEKGVKAIALTSGISQDDMITLFDNLQFGDFKFLYLSPERLQSRFIQEKIKQLNVRLIAIDEAHCISEWGHDFRPSYRNIKILRELKPTVPFIALTASATKEVLEDIDRSLEMKDAAVFKKSFYRSNLAYQLFTVEDKLHRLIQIFNKTTSPAIVYVSSRKKTKEIATFLNTNGFKASYYNGGITTAEKQISFDNWMSEKAPIMVATNAFGMGIDKDNVKVVVHLDLPNSVENYIQEAGRAGRNNKKAFAVLLFNKSDIRIYSNKFTNAFHTITEMKNVYTKLHQHFLIANGEHSDTSYEFNSFEFCQVYGFNIQQLNNTLKIFSNNGIIDLTEGYENTSNVQFLISSSQVIAYSKQNATVKELITMLLRSYGGLFEQETTINEYRIAKQSNINYTIVVQLLTKLHDEGVIRYNKASDNTYITFLLPREDKSTINRIAKNSSSYINQKKRKSESLIQFVENSQTCRNIQILNYFDEHDTKECGICDVCLSKRNRSLDVNIQIKECLKKEGLLTSKQLCALISLNDDDVLVNLQHLLSEDLIDVNEFNQYYLK